METRRRLTVECGPLPVIGDKKQISLQAYHGKQKPLRQRKGQQVCTTHLRAALMLVNKRKIPFLQKWMKLVDRGRQGAIPKVNKCKVSTGVDYTRLLLRSTAML